ncbi:hypothetical protein HDU86_003577 [Geranomyces michiganensis]|nr:hypothetical protein HDU86_003577 [Geranomyces michiganensis]
MTANAEDDTPSPGSTLSPVDIIKRPEPAVAGGGGSISHSTSNNEVRRVFSLGALSAPTGFHQHLGFGASSLGALTRSISVGTKSIPVLDNVSAGVVSGGDANGKDDGEAAATTTPDALPSEAAEAGTPKRAPAGTAAGDGGSSNGRAFPSRRRPSAASSRQQRSVTTRNGDAVAEAAVALLAAAEDDEAAAGLASKKRNSDFHDLFATLPKDDLLVEDYACAWQKEVLIQGRMYLSQRHISFYANLLGWVHSISIPFADVVALDKKYVAAIIPNSLEISTATSKYFFASFMHRDVTFGQIKNLWDVAVNQTFQLHPMSASPQAAYPSTDLSTPETETDDADRGRDLDGPEAVNNNNRSLSLDSLQERLKMGGDQVKKRVAAYMNDTAESKAKAKEAAAQAKKQIKTTPTKASPVEKVAGPSASPVDAESSAVHAQAQETKSRASSLPEGVLKDQVQILVNGLESETVPATAGTSATTTPTTTADFVSNGPPLPHRAAAALSIAIVADEGSTGEEETPSHADAFSTPAEMAPTVGDEAITTASEPPPAHPHHHSAHPHIVIHHSHHAKVQHRHPHSISTASTKTVATATTPTNAENGQKLRRRNPHRPKRPAVKKIASLRAPPAAVMSPPASCGCETAHEKMIPVLDAVFHISLDMLWVLLYSQAETTGGFLKRFLEEKRKCREFMFHDWVPPDADLPEPASVEIADLPVEVNSLRKGWQRKLEYVVPLGGPIGPKQTRCKLHETVFQHDDSRYVLALVPALLKRR